MARPQIIKDNRSSYNLIAHEHHVPQSPLFGPGPQHMKSTQQRDYEYPSQRREYEYPSQPREYVEERPRAAREDRGMREEAEEGQREVKFIDDQQQGRDEWDNVKEAETSRRSEPDYKIRKDYRTSNDMIQHEQHVPASPLYRPGQGPGQAQGQGRSQFDPRFAGIRGGYEDGEFTTDDKDQQRTLTPIKQQNHLPASPLYRPGGTPKVEADPRYGRAPGWREFETWNHFKGSRMPDGTDTRYGSLGGTIGHVNHLPVSPLYRTGQGRGMNMADPRYGSAQGQRQFATQEVPRPKDPPTPDYNTQQLHFSENNDDDTKLQLGGLRGSQEDLRDDRPVNRGPPYSDRAGFHPGDRSYREQPWTQRDRFQGDIHDPRLGGGHEGMGLSGSRNGGALLFIRFAIGQGENIQVAAQAFLKSKTHDNGGRFLGLAKKVFDFGYEKHPVEAVGVFHFPTMEKAFLFFQMDPIIRQPDFPPPYGHAEMWIISNAYLPDNLQLFSTFLLSEVELHSGKDKREFFDTFQKPFESYLYKNGAMPFVICSYGAHDRKSLRRHTYPPSSIVTCHLFQGLDHLNWITNDETYSKFRSLHNQMATEKCSIFTLSKDMFP